MRRVLVTGGTGFIGSHLISYLVEKGVSVRCLARKTSDCRRLEGMDVEYVFGDITDYDSLIPAVTGMDAVFHVAGRTKSSTEEEFYQANVIGTVNLLKGVVQANPNLKRFLYVSSQAAVGPSRVGSPVTESDPPHPVTPYGASKLAGEEAVMAFSSQIPVTIVRPSVVYGPRDTNIFEFFRMVSKGIKPVLGWRDRYASFIYIEDLIQGLYLAARSEKAIGQIYFLVCESRISWRELDREIAKALKKKAITIHIPISIAILIALFRETFAKIKGETSMVNREKIRELRERFWICDGSKAEEELGFHPRISLREGIERSASWYEEEGWL